MSTEAPAQTRRQFSNRPRWVNAAPIAPNAELFDRVVAAFGSAAILCAFIKAFAIKRFQTTGWRTIKDVTSRDTKRASGRPGVEATEMLETPFQSLTATMAAKVQSINPDLKLTREDSLGVLAALKTEQAVLERAGIKMWDEVNQNLGYLTIGLSAVPGGQIPEDAKALAAEIEYEVGD